MTCQYQSCYECPLDTLPKRDRGGFDRDVLMRSLEGAGVRLGMHWSAGDEVKTTKPVCFGRWSHCDFEDERACKFTASCYKAEQIRYETRGE